MKAASSLTKPTPTTSSGASPSGIMVSTRRRVLPGRRPGSTRRRVDTMMPEGDAPLDVVGVGFVSEDAAFIPETVAASAAGKAQPPYPTRPRPLETAAPAPPTP